MKMDTFKNDYRIHTSRMESLEAAIEKINKKAVKLHQPKIMLSLLKIEDDFLHVSIWGETPMVKGFTFLASIDHNGEGNILRVIPGVELPKFYRDADAGNCDHCKKYRRRLSTFILRNNEKQTHCQVGRNCLADFLGGIDPHNVAAYLELLAEAGMYAETAQEPSNGGSYGEANYDDLEVYLSYVSETINRYGWLSRSIAKTQVNSISTADRANHQLHPGPRDKREYSPSEEAKEEAKAAIEMGRSLLGAKAELNDYEHNLHTTIKADIFKSRYIGIVASLIPWYRRQLNYAINQTEKATKAAISQYVGNVGQRGVFKLTLESRREINGSYGVTTLLNMRDAEGNMVCWFQSGLSPLKIGNTYEIIASVKSHSEYNGVKQTTITRGKVS